jgi:hypothetical protein
MFPYKFGSYLGEHAPNIEYARTDDRLRENFGKHLYGNIFTHEVERNWSRVKIGANEKNIPLMLAIAENWEGPYWILYVLKVPILGHEPGRYQSPQCPFDELELFAYTFQNYFEGDGRHDVWFKDIASSKQLIYDNHDLIYSYGEDNSVIDFLKVNDFKEGHVIIPDPHQHCYNQEYNKDEDEIIGYFNWTEFHLKDSDG